MAYENPGAQARLHLLNANRGAIAIMLGQAADSGLASEHAVVAVVDQRDPVGRALAEAAADRQTSTLLTKVREL